MHDNSIGDSGTFTPPTKEIIKALWRIEKLILHTLNFNEVVQKIVDALLSELGYLNLGYKIIVLALADNEKGVLRRISISQTPEAKEAIRLSRIPFQNIDIPLTAESNVGIQVLRSGRSAITYDWANVLGPVFEDKEARKIQELVGIRCSMVLPVIYQGKPQGVIIFSMTKDEFGISSDEKDLLTGFTDIVGLAVQNSRLYSSLEETSNELQSANKKLQELDLRKDEFLNIAAHELRAPMTAIKGYLSMIMEGDAGVIPDKVKEFLTEVAASNDRLIRLVNNMLNTARIEENRQVYTMAIVNLSSVVNTVFREFNQDAINKKLNYQLMVMPSIKDTVYVDSDRIHEVIGNFISNAIKYTDTGSVNVRLVQPTPKTIRFEVVDSGPGIAEKDQVRLFEKFYRVENENLKRAAGTGLGLYISKLLVEKFEGKIGFITAPNQGSTFWFELPITAEAAPKPNIMV